MSFRAFTGKGFQSLMVEKFRYKGGEIPVYIGLKVERFRYLKALYVERFRHQRWRDSGTNSQGYPLKMWISPLLLCMLLN